MSFQHSLLRLLVTLASRSPGGERLSILIYHRVLPVEDAVNDWDVTREEFDAQMGAIAAYFHALPLSEAVERLTRRSLPPRAVCITFDDGYADNADVALPVLKRHNLPATFFVASGYLDGGCMWNDLVIEALRIMRGPVDLARWGLGTLTFDDIGTRRTAIKRVLPILKYLPTAEREAGAAWLAERAGVNQRPDLMMRSEHVRTLHSAGMEVGAHTVTHPILRNTSDDAARHEICESGRCIAEILRVPVTLFAYPNGKPGRDYGPEHVQMVREAGYAAGASTAWGAAGKHADIYQLPRFTPWDRTPGRFALRLARNALNVRPDVAR